MKPRRLFLIACMLVVASCIESKKDYEFAPGWYEDNSRVPAPSDAPHGYFEIYYMAGGQRCLVDDRARTMRALGDGCIVYPTDTAPKDSLRVQCVGRRALLISRQWDAALENSHGRLQGQPFESWKAEALRQPGAPCFPRNP